MRTGKNVLNKIAAYKEHNYDAHGHYMFSPPHISTHRAMGRFIKSGRFVPPEYLMNSTTNEKSFDKAKPHFSKYSIWDNTGDDGPQLHGYGEK
jgi:hypothetical protein